MSEYINNREYRQTILKEVLKELHDGKSVEEVQGKFADAFSGVSAEEIAQAENALIADGLPISEIQRLCDVHAAVFKGSIEEIHRENDPFKIIGHPANTLKRENAEIEKHIQNMQKTLSVWPEDQAIETLIDQFEKLKDISRHYAKKENLFFPYMENYGITTPTQVMWGVDDEIRAKIKEITIQLKENSNKVDKSEIKALLTRVTEMIFKEENIMVPMLLENLTQEEWVLISKESDEFGYFGLDKVPLYQPITKEEKKSQEEVNLKQELPGKIILPTGVLETEQLVAMLNTLPFDITFVDKDDTVRYFSQGLERIFPRTTAIIGRKVSNCHPPASVHIVEKIVEDLRNGVKDHEDFWINMGPKFILIRYFAVRNENGEYLGVLEVTQDIKGIKELEGEKRLVSE